MACEGHKAQCVAHISGKQKLVADFKSCQNQRESDWELENKAPLSALSLDFTPEIDLLASHTCHITVCYATCSHQASRTKPLEPTILSTHIVM